jgi:dephospho-CoA kinase
MLKVALTGNVASGKSTVARLWSEAGVPVVRADDLAREVVVPGSEGLSRVVAALGEEILEADGSLSRARLRDRIFRNPSERRQVEAILHPLIGAHRNRWMEELEAEGAALGIAEIPLLFEAGLEGEFDAVVLVDAPQKEQLRRIRDQRGIEEEEALRIMAAQIPSAEKRSRADFLLENGGSLEDLEVRAMALLDLLRARARRGTSP